MLGDDRGAQRLARHRGLHRARRRRVQHLAGPGSDSATAELALGLLIAAARAWRRRCEHPRRKIPDGRAARHRAERQDAGDHRPRPARQPHGALRQCARHEGDRLEPEPDRGEGGGGRRHHGEQRGVAVTADVVSIHLVLSPRSRGLLGAADLA